MKIIFFNNQVKSISRRHNTFRVVAINKYRSFYIDVKNAIAFAFFKIKNYYDSRH